MWTVESGVHGAMRISYRDFATREEAEEYAARIRRGNSAGHYWAVVTRSR
jgi:hypothetical protein